MAFASLTTKMVTLIDWLHEDDEQVAVRWRQPIGRDPLFGRLAIAHDHVYAIKLVGHERYNAGVLRLPKCRQR